MAIGTGNHPKELWPGVKATFGGTYDEHVEEWSQIFDVQSSDKAFEEYVQQKALGVAPLKGQGEPIQMEDTSQGYVSRITNLTYALMGRITREAIEDGQYENIANRIARYLSFSIRQTEELVGANVINRAFSSSYVGGDAVSLCSASHPDNGTQSNLLAVAAEFSEAALEDLLTQIANAEDPKGNKISLVGMKLILPTALMFEATRVLESMGRSATAENDVNAIRQMGLLPGGVCTNHYLSSTTAWFVKTNAPEGLIAQNRRAVEFDKDNDFVTEDALMKASRRIGFGWGDWRAVYGTPGA